jgi:hypothetical protein
MPETVAEEYISVIPDIAVENPALRELALPYTTSWNI